MASLFGGGATEGYLSKVEAHRGVDTLSDDEDKPNSSNLSTSGYSPTPGGPFSALTPSMWPQDILAKLSQPEAELRGSTEADDYCYDEFGFRVDESSSEEVSNSAGQTPLETEQHRMKWIAHLEFTRNIEVEDLTWEKIGASLPHNDKMKTLVEEGIPHSLRAHIWPRLCGAFSKRASAETSYKDVVRSSSNDALVTSKQIEKDLLRTMPSNACFSSIHSTGVGRLRRILRALAWLYPDIGYCQGMGVIVSCLLLLMEEEDVFWMMCSLLEDLIPPSYYSTSLLGVQADQRVLVELVSCHLTEVDNVLKDHDIDISLITLHWFLTLFASVVRTRVLLRLWDRLFYHGSLVFFQMSAGMLTPDQVEEHRRRHLAHLMADHGGLINPHSAVSALPGQKISRRQLKRSRSLIAELLSGGGGEGGDGGGDDKAKNVRQTELIVNLRESILQVARHFQSTDGRYGRVSLVGDYSMESHQRDHDNFIATIQAGRKRRAKALLDFERHDDDELGFKKNDIINIVSRRDEHCWVGELNGLRGWFPAKFVQLLDERSKHYSTAGDDTINEHIADLVRGHLCPAIKAILEHGLKKSSLLGGVVCHPWLFIEEAASREVQRDFNSVYSRLVLCKTFRLDEDGKVLSPEEILYRCVQLVVATHDPHHAQMDVKLRSLICLGLNEQVLHLWLETLCSSQQTVEKWYQPWSFLRSPGWVQIKCELRILSQFAFTLTPDWELPATARRETHLPLKEGVRDMLVKHHLFSWDL